MRKVILDVAVSLDGYIEGPNGEYDWCFMDQDYGFTDLWSKIDAVLYGRKSWELFGNFKPSANSSLMEQEFFRVMSGMKKYVFSRTLKSVKGAELINENAHIEVQKIKNQTGKDIYLFGGANLAATFINLNLIDEYILAFHPVILGAGKPLFQDIKERKNLELADSKIYSSGLVILRYVPKV